MMQLMLEAEVEENAIDKNDSEHITEYQESPRKSQNYASSSCAVTSPAGSPRKTAAAASTGNSQYGGQNGGLPETAVDISEHHAVYKEQAIARLQNDILIEEENVAENNNNEDKAHSAENCGAKPKIYANGLSKKTSKKLSTDVS